MWCGNWPTQLHGSAVDLQRTFHHNKFHRAKSKSLVDAGFEHSNSSAEKTKTLACQPTARLVYAVNGQAEGNP